MIQLPLGIRPRTAATFDTYAPGLNAEVLAALRGSGAAPLWLWGAEGSGKSHLLQATCAATGGTAAYLPLDRSFGMPAAALLGYERCRVVCLDDVDAVAGDPAWEHVLFRLFNEALDLGNRLIFAAGAAPQQLDWSLDDWRSRAAACVIYQLRPLDDAGLINALRLRAAQRGLDLPLETCDYLLRRLPRDLPSLFVVLEQLDEASLAAQRRLTVPFIRDALESLAGIRP